MSAVSDSLFDPTLHFFCDPRYSARTELYPRRELPSRFKSRDVREAVRNAINRFEILLRYQLPCHRKSLVERDVATPGLAS